MIRSADVAGAVAFYTQLGLQFVAHRHGGGPEHYSSEEGGRVFEIYPASAKSPPTISVRLGFQVEAVDELINQLEREGVEILTPPADSEWGRRAVVRDADGHAIELLTCSRVKTAA